MRILLLLGLASCFVSAQSVSIGVKGGIPITDALDIAQGNAPLSPSYIANNHRYLVGGTVQLNLGRFAIEVDGIYRRLGFQTQQTVGNTLVTTSTTANSWEFPVVGKYALMPGPIRPFVDAGANFRRITNAQQAGTSIVPQLANDFAAGFTFGAGVELKLGKLRIDPEFRYTHWGTQNFHDPVNSLLQTNLNQGDFMVGLTF